MDVRQLIKQILTFNGIRLISVSKFKIQNDNHKHEKCISVKVSLLRGSIFVTEINKSQ